MMNNATGARWMVVDDDVDTLNAITRVLAAVTGAQIFPFASPWQAFDAIAAEPKKFDLVITDLEMPGMNGLDFRRHLKAISPKTKVLLTTGSGAFSEESAREKGFCGLLCKPFSIAALQQTLAKIPLARPHF